MLAAQSYRGMDSIDARVNGCIGMGYRALWTLPEEVDEAQPLELPEAGLMLVWHGRIDNRADLCSRLGINSREAYSWSDARLFLRLYADRGRRALGLIVGAFAAAIYDRSARSLTLVRDPLGHREVNFHVAHDVLVAATQESGVLAHPRVHRRINPLRLAGYFAFTGPYSGETFFDGVYKLLPGHVLTVAPQGTSTERYWTPDVSGRVRCRDHREYVEQFRELLEQAVSCRTRAVGPVGVMTSGGLDSGPVAALAARGREPVYSLSWVFERFKECDERVYLEPLWRQSGLEPVPVNCDEAGPYSDFENWPVHPDTPDQDPYRRFVDRTYAAARDRNVRVLLNGGGGDALYLGGDHWFWELVCSGSPGQALDRARWFVGKDGIYRFFRNILFRSLIPHQWIRRLRPSGTPAWLTEEAAGLLRHRVPWPPECLGAYRPAQCRNLMSQRIYDFINAESYWANQHGIEMRYPFLDRRLIEFMLDLPDHVLNYKGTSRSILRNSVGDLLPDAQLNRPDKTHFSPLYHHGASQAAESIRRCLDDPAAIWSRYVRKEWVMDNGAATQTERDTLIWVCVSAELWRVKQNAAL